MFYKGLEKMYVYERCHSHDIKNLPADFNSKIGGKLFFNTKHRQLLFRCGKKHVKHEKNKDIYKAIGVSPG